VQICIDAPRIDQVAWKSRCATGDQVAYIIDSANTKDPIKLTLSFHRPNRIRVHNLPAERIAVAPAEWKLEFKKDVIAGCHERLDR
jgi:hypothetical protein